MNDIEAIHAIEVMLAEEEICGCFDFAPIELAALSYAIAAMKGRSDAGGTRLPEAVKKMLDVTCSALIVEAGATEAPFVAMIQCEKIYSEGDTAEAAIDKLAAKLEKTK